MTLTISGASAIKAASAAFCGPVSEQMPINAVEFWPVGAGYGVGFCFAVDAAVAVRGRASCPGAGRPWGADDFKLNGLVCAG